MVCVFLAAVDQVCLSALHIDLFDTRGQKTIIATALPTIVSDLKGGSRYSWVGRFVVSSQILSIEVIDLPLYALVPICCCQPGRLSTLLVLLISLDSFGSLSPLYGKLSDLIGRKPVLYSSIGFFLVRPFLYFAHNHIYFVILQRLGLHYVVPLKIWYRIFFPLFLTHSFQLLSSRRG